jgi:hypothetical protein
MRKQFFLLAAAFMIASISLGQTTREKKLLEKFENFIYKNDTIKAVKKNKEESELLVLKLKNRGKVNDTIKKQYTDAKLAYDKLLNTMIKDIGEVGSIGGLVEILIKNNENKKKYSALGFEANKLNEEFVSNAKKILGDDMGILKSLIDWSLSLLPGWVNKISDASIKIASDIIIKNLNEARFRDWDEII